MYIDRVDIDAPYRGQGHGLAMIARTILEFAGPGAQVLLIPSDAKLIAYWERLGFELLCPKTMVMALDTSYQKPLRRLMGAARVQAMAIV